jgi:hypothetical protein
VSSFIYLPSVAAASSAVATLLPLQANVTAAAQALQAPVESVDAITTSADSHPPPPPQPPPPPPVDADDDNTTTVVAAMMGSVVSVIVFAMCAVVYTRSRPLRLKHKEETSELVQEANTDKAPASPDVCEATHGAPLLNCKV